jgi:prefoldin subunit 5
MLQEENQKLKEFIQTMGDQMNKLTQKVEEVEECQVVNLRSR